VIKTLSFHIILVMALAAGVPDAIRAQEPPPENRYDDDIEEVVVTGKRREGSGGGRRTVATREELDRSDQTGMDGFFDDIDGLSTLGGDDQGNAFSIDGLSADLGNVTLNGQGFGEGGGSGGFGAGDLPPDMIRRVDVFKMPTAAMEEGGSAGSVNLQLRNPVAITDHSVSSKARLGYVPDDSQFNPSASLFSGGPSENRRFGYMLNATLSENTREYASQDVTRWLPAEFDDQQAYYPAQLRNNEVKDRNRNGFAGLTLGFRPRENLEVSANVFLTRKERFTRTHSLQQRFEKQRDIDFLAIDGRIVSELESSDKSRENLRISGTVRDDRVDSLLLGLNAVWRLVNWRLNGAAGYSQDENESVTPSQSASFAANSRFGYAARAVGGLRTWEGDAFEPISAFELSRVNLSDRRTDDSNAFAGIDAMRLLEGDFFRRLRFGWKSRESSRERKTSTGRASADGALTLEDFFDGRFLRTPWDTDAWPSSDMAAVDRFVQDKDISWKENLLNEYDMDRRTDAAYLQMDYRVDRDERRLVAGSVGLRAVDTETRIDAYQADGQAMVPYKSVNKYTDFLPSLMVRARLANRTLLTTGAARVMTHPAFNNLAPGIRVNYGEKTARSGNPDLEPFRANQYLAELTRASNGRRVTVNLTYRDVKTYFVLGEESLEIDDDVFLLTRPVNGQDGSILTGGVAIEQNLARLSRRLQGYSLSLSYIHNHSRTKLKDPLTGETLPMPNTAEHVGKVEFAYGGKVFSGKLSYQWRGDALRAPVSESGLSVWNQPSANLNLNLGWVLDNGVRISLDGRNLLAGEQEQTTDAGNQYWRITERDRTLAATVQTRW
jgi:TonB-dependent receptor